MSRKRIAFIGASVIAGVCALVVAPIAANAGQAAELSASCPIADGATVWRATSTMAIRNDSAADAKDWTLEFDLSEGVVAYINDPGTFELRQDGRHVTVTAVEGRSGVGVPAGGERKVDVWFNPTGKAVPQISGCKVNGGQDGDGGGTPEDTTAPTVPVEDGSHVLGHNKVHVMWKASQDSGSGVDRYEVFQDGKLAKTVRDGLRMTDIEGLKPATTYRFKVRAVDVAGNASGFSKEIKLTTHLAPGDDTQKPVIPEQLTGEAAGPNQVSLNWKAATDNVAVTGYRIYRNGEKLPQEESADATTAVVGGLSSNTAYRFKVTAVDGSGNESDPTREITVTTAAGGGGGGATAPGDFSAATSAKQDGPVTQHYLDLGWTVPKGQGRVSTYQVYLNGKLAQTVMWGTGDPVMPIPSDRVTREVLVGSQGGKTYTVKVRAQLGDGSWGTFSAERSVTTGR